MPGAWPTRCASSGGSWSCPTAAARPSGGRTWPRRSSAEPANAARLEAEGLGTFSALLEAYLIPGRPAYRRRTLPTVGEAIALVHDAGGVAVWAHPFWDLDHDDEVLEAVDRFAALGVDGVEAFYVTHTEAQTRLVAGHAEARGLLTTGSADFHGPDHPLFSRFRAFSTYDLAPRLGPIPELAAG